MGEHSLWDGKYGCLSTWNKFRLQLRSAFQPQIIIPSRVIQAYPPGEDFPFGNCDTVLIETMRDDGQMSMYVFVLVFSTDFITSSRPLYLPTYLSTLLLYIQYFHFITSPDEQPKLSMWTVEHSYVQDNTGNRYRQGTVVQITDITHTIELIPCFGEKVASDISLATCLEHHKHFFLNNFADKESYHTFSTEFV
ncbi:hypothetical protein BDR06DRAFT_900040 [Suillus hirtellus]|nr:hypothetical protein BDR06DRAFT_900040 [Suillus hirtellus]